MENKLTMNELKSCVGGFSDSGVDLVTGMLSPKGTHSADAPVQALPGAIKAFTNIINNVGDIKNLSIYPPLFPV